MSHDNGKLPAPTIQEEQLLDRTAAAKYLGLKPGTLAVWDCTKRYNLKPIKVGKLVRYKRSVIEKFLEDRMSP